PGAVSIPLFDDDERAIVGTTYTKSGSSEAVLAGLEIAGPKLKHFVSQAKELATNGELLVHCWRGGMRSEAMAWLFAFSGIKTHLMEGGYKAYRHYVRASFSTGPSIIILGGLTGSGKTELLQFLSEQGEQMIDLEGLAHHKGSAFGSLGQEDQPTNEQFENDLAAKWFLLNPAKPVWVEDESQNIGKIMIPDPLFAKMKSAQVVFIDMPFEERVYRLVQEYGCFKINDLSSLIQKIEKRLGGDASNAAIKTLHAGDIGHAVSIVLKYYDKTYRYGLSKRDSSKIIVTSYAEFRRGYKELI
ncbi:MAG: tRNA 2-selenouridine(34) synthase MnmH, partial [Bacteroidales bacterium]|nr:tRNA 2-selenouridine(34) synthase MnmH [Bacteroidales bacterium]